MIKRGLGGLRWNIGSAVLGGLVWVVVLLYSSKGHTPIGTIEALFLLAPLVIVPLGLRLVANATDFESDQHFLGMAGVLQPFGAILVVVSFGLAPGRIAGLLSSGWLLITGLVGLSGFLRLFQRGLAQAEEACFGVGLLYLFIGGVWLVLSRLGISPMGFQEPIVLLTAVHFHYTGFATPLIAGVIGRVLEQSSLPARRLFRFVCLGVIGGTPLIAAGFVFSPILKIVSISLLSASLIALAVLIGIVVLPRVHSRLAQVLLAVSAGSVIIGMVLVGVYAVGEFTGHLLISIPQMARVHGMVNSIGFTLCGLVACLLLRQMGGEK